MEEVCKFFEYQLEGDNFFIILSDLDKSSMKEGDLKFQEELEDINIEVGYQGIFGIAFFYYYLGIGRGMLIFIMFGQGNDSFEMQFFIQVLR